MFGAFNLVGGNPTNHFCRRNQALVNYNCASPRVCASRGSKIKIIENAVGTGVRKIE